VTDLVKRKCEPCEGAVIPLNAEQAKTLLTQLEGWSISDDGLMIYRDFSFDGFLTTMAFVNAMAWIANAEDHHPDFETGYRHCLVRLTTHAINGLSDNDFICAAKINALIED
jgi:4a-hydroxytetrahydrobiopterin dehydratase